MRLLALLLFCAAACAPAAATGVGESEVGTPPPKAWEPLRVKDGNVRIASFNIRNFPKDTMAAPPDGGAEPEVDRAPLVRKQLETDEAMLVDVLEKLDFDVLGVQEINDPARLEAVLARLGERNGRTYEAVFSTEWPHPQKTGIVVRSDRFRIESPRVHPEIATRETMRAGLTARIASKREGGVDFGMLVVHLASGDGGSRVRLRAEQAAQAAKVVAALQAEWNDPDFVVVGDFNTAKETEMPEFDAALGGEANGLSRRENASGCSTYYTKSATNPLLQPSLIDHVYLASFEELDPAVPLVSGAHCAERSCEAFESDSVTSGTTYWGVSDHCPVYFEIADVDRD